MTELPRRLLVIIGASYLFLLTSCTEQSPVWHGEEAPQRLSEWQLFSTAGRQLSPVAETLVYRPASTLFSDYAQKLRSLWIPDGQQAQLLDGELQYPVGTVLSKTFYYPSTADGRVQARPDLKQQSINLENNRLLETRLLVRQASGWLALPYIWNDEESEAFLRVAGGSKALTLAGEETGFQYFVPNQNQCSGCHQTEHPDGDLHPLGARLSQLTATGPELSGDESSQIAALVERGWLNAPPAAQQAVDWSDTSQPVADRALAYLNMNCGHCHNPAGPADTSALILNGGHRSATELGVCKPPVAAGGGAGNLRYGIVPGEPESSILLYRMRSTAPDEMMPELGRALEHKEGIRLISDWIEQMPGSCRTAP